MKGLPAPLLLEQILDVAGAVNHPDHTDLILGGAVEDQMLGKASHHKHPGFREQWVAVGDTSADGWTAGDELKGLLGRTVKSKLRGAAGAGSDILRLCV